MYGRDEHLDILTLPARRAATQREKIRCDFYLGSQQMRYRNASPTWLA